MTEFAQPIELIVSQRKVYKSNAVRVGTFLGGPLVAGYLIAENYKAFNENDKAKRSWLCAIAAMLLLLTGVFFIPEQGTAPKIIIPLIYSWFAFYLVQNLQGTRIDWYIEAGGGTQSWWRVIGAGLIGAIATFTLILIAVFFVSQVITL